MKYPLQPVPADRRPADDRGHRAHWPPASRARCTTDELRVVVFNPLPRPLAETAELTLQIPTDWPTFNEFFGFEPKPAFRIYDAGGQELPYQRLGQAMNRAKLRMAYDRFPESYRSQRRARSACRCSMPAHGLHHAHRARRRAGPAHAPSGGARPGHQRALHGQRITWR